MLSIIIITKNEEENLPRLLASLKAQDFNDYEIIVSDAKSTDHTRDIAARANCRIVDGGMPSTGRNNGATAAQGDILLFLDADVELPPGFLSHNMAEFNARQLDAAGVYVTPATDNILFELFHHVLNGYMYVSQLTFPHMPGFCIFARAGIHRTINGFDPTILLSEDSDYVNRAHKLGKFRMLKSKKIICSVRRLEKENSLILALKYFLVPLYRLVFGEIRTDIFKYRFDHYKNKK